MLPFGGAPPAHAQSGAPDFGTRTIADQTWIRNLAIDALTLPEAGGGDGTLTYALPDLPAGLTFDPATRVLRGTPTATGTTSMTYTVADSDDDTATLEFDIKVTADCAGTPAVAAYTSNQGIIDDCNALLAAENPLVGTGTALDWAPGTAMGSWTSVTVSGTPPRVTEVSLELSSLKGTVPAALGDLSALEILNLSFNDLSGSIPAALGNLSALKGLGLERNALSGSIPAALGKLDALENLGARYNRLSGSIPVELGDLSALEYLDLEDNDLSGSIPEKLGDLSALKGLYLDDNELSGSIPAKLGELDALVELFLDNNDLSGSIPAKLGELSALKALFLDNNDLSGPIPAELGELGALKRLFLDNNDLSGSIPAALGDLSALEYLNLDGNELSGSIPAELGDLPVLKSLSLANNRLAGAIPPKLADLGTLSSLSLAGNQLEAPLTVTFDPATLAEDAGATDVMVTVTADAGTVWAAGHDDSDGPVVDDIELGAALSGDSPAVAVTVPTFTAFDIADGATSATVTVTVTPTDDAVATLDEVLTVTVTGGTGAPGIADAAAGGDGSLTVTDDEGPELSVDAPDVAEGDDGTTAALVFTVTLSGPTSQEVTVDYADAGTAADGTATSGTDYQAITADTLTFAAGDTSKTINVTVNGDTAPELDETVVITLSNAVNAALPSDPTGTGTITNDDVPVVTIEGSSVDEGDGEDEEVPAELEFTVRLSGPVSHPVTVDFADAGSGTATSGEDYVAIGPGTLAFQPGDTETALTLTVHGDTAVEPHETVVIVLSHPNGAVFAGGAEIVTGTGTIRRDDGTPTPPPPPGSSPVADAGADLVVDPEVPVALDGSGSSDPDGDALTFAWSPASGPEVTLAGADTAAPSFTAPWQPGDLVFRLTVRDPVGRAGSDEVTVTVRDLAPAFGSAAVSSPALVVGEAMEALVLPEATGGNGVLTYGLTSEPAGLAGLSFDPETRRLTGTPTEEGSHDFTWRAEDADENRADSDAAVLTFGVTVDDPRTALMRKAVKRTLAAVARRALSSALENIGARFAASIPDSGLTLAGATVPFGAAGTPGLDGISGMDGAAGQGGAAGRCPIHAPHRHGFRAGMDGCSSAGLRSREVETDEMLRTSAFSLTLGAAEGSDPDGSPGPLWSVWGRGDLGTFAGRPEPGVRHDGELRTGWLGIDARAGRWVAGLALSHGRGEADYGFDQDGVSGQGRLETTLNALYPYGRWTFDEGLELRAVLGAGTGEARHVLDDGPTETSDLSMRMASVGVRRKLPALGEVDLAVRADASVARLETDSGPQYIDNLTADTWRGRVGMEAARPFALGEEGELTPFVEAAGRRDGGDGLSGAGLELAGGVRYRAPGLELEARGRWLAAHTEAGARERGVSVTARAGPGAHGRGLSLLVSPRWGAGTAGAQALWSEEMPRLSGGEAASLDARMGYGVALSPPQGRLAPRGLLTPFVETGLGGGDRHRFRLGTRFDASRMDLGVEFAGERRESGRADPEHTLRLDISLRF